MNRDGLSSDRDDEFGGLLITRNNVRVLSRLRKALHVLHGGIYARSDSIRSEKHGSAGIEQGNDVVGIPDS